MKSVSLFSAALALSLSLAAPTALAHVGHGDEFQATGGVNRVTVNEDTDALLGIQVAPIEPVTDGSNATLIPVTALVDDNERQLVFVQYENFYEPVEVVTGETQGELIEITEGLSIGEQLVTQGSLSLYAESRKTQTADAEPASDTSDTSVDSSTETTIIEESVQATTTESPSETASGGFPTKAAGAIGVGIIAVAGAAVALNTSRSGKDLS